MMHRLLLFWLFVSYGIILTIIIGLFMQSPSMAKSLINEWAESRYGEFCLV